MNERLKNWKYTPYLLILGAVSIFLIGNHATSIIIRSSNMELSERLKYFSAHFLKSFVPGTSDFFLIDFYGTSLLVGLLMVGLVYYFYMYYSDIRRNFRPKEEHGSAKYEDVLLAGDSLKNQDNPDYSVIYSDNVSISMDTYKTLLNNNTLTVGGSGSGKTRFHVKPNLLNMACNYIVTDPKDLLVREVGNAFYSEGYDMKYLNLVNFAKSMRYNPLKYIYKPNDVLRFVNNLVASTTKNNKNAGNDEFFEKSEIALLSACIFYIFAVTEYMPWERNIPYLMDLIDAAEASEEDENMKSALDIAFEQLEAETSILLENGKMDSKSYKNSYAFLAQRQYNLYKKAAGKTAKSILISIGVRMAVFNLPELMSLLEYDELDLETIGCPKPQPLYDTDTHIQRKDSNGNFLFVSEDGQPCVFKNIDDNGEKQFVNSDGIKVKPKLQKTILFCAISDSDSTFNFLASILYQQLFDLLYRQADAREEGKLPIHTRFILDEFGNISRINDFEIKVATMRSREISVDVIVQNLAQLKNAYKDSWETIEGNCDTTLFLGGKEYSTLERLSKYIGNETVDYRSITENRGGSNSGSWSFSNQLINRPLLSPDEIKRLPVDECLIDVRGKNVIRDKKYNLLKHHRVSLTEDGDKSLRFNTDLIRKVFASAAVKPANAWDGYKATDGISGALELLSQDVYLDINADNIY